MPRTTKFHDYAKAGDLKRFEQQARGVSMTVPLDDEGCKPSEVASDKYRNLIAALEVKYFVKAN